MCNKAGVGALTRPGDAVVCEAMAHVMRFEGGGASAISGVMFEPLVTDRGWFTPSDLDAVPVGGNVYQSRSSLVCMENTHNFAGGTVWPIEVYESVAAKARERGSSVFTDGARLLNAVVASGIAADRWAAPVDGIWIDLSKGLGCPGGAVLAGSADFLAEANRFKYLLGGAMRQSGVLAAAGVGPILPLQLLCAASAELGGPDRAVKARDSLVDLRGFAAGLYALDHHVDRLADDHEHARRLAEGLADAGFAVEAPETNMVYFDPAPVGLTLEAAVAAFEERGIRVVALAGRVRAVTHLGGAGDRGGR